MIEQVKKHKIGEDQSSITQEHNSRNKEADSLQSNLLTDEEAFELSKDDSVLQDIIYDVRENPEAALDKNYMKIFKYAAEQNLKDFQLVKEDISRDKNNLDKNIKENKGGFSVDISKKHFLKKNFIEVFGRKSNVITYDDYSTLLELKKLLDIDEQIGLSGFEKI